MKEEYEKAKTEIHEFTSTEVMTDSYIELPEQDF